MLQTGASFARIAAGQGVSLPATQRIDDRDGIYGIYRRSGGKNSRQIKILLIDARNLESAGTTVVLIANHTAQIGGTSPRSSSVRRKRMLDSTMSNGMARDCPTVAMSSCATSATMKNGPSSATARCMH